MSGATPLTPYELGCQLVADATAKHLAQPPEVVAVPTESPPLQAIIAVLKTYCHLPSEAHYALVAAWIAHTHVARRFRYTPILALTSPAGGYGKSRLLSVLHALCAGAQRYVGLTEAAAVRAIRAGCKTLLLDELDAMTSDGAWQRFFNGGTEQGLTLSRMSVEEGKRGKAEVFEPFGPKAVAFVPRFNRQPFDATTWSRTIVIECEQSPVPLPEWPLEVPSDALACREALVAWAAGVGALPMPAEIERLPFGRARDKWAALFACGAVEQLLPLALNAQQETSDLDGLAHIRLLGDLQPVLKKAKDGFLPSQSILDWLLSAECGDGEWREFSAGRPLSTNKLARLLKLCRVKPRRTEQQRGYRVADLEKAIAQLVKTDS